MTSLFKACRAVVAASLLMRCAESGWISLDDRVATYAPQSADANTKRTLPPRRIHLRPYMSESLAKIGTAIVDVSRYAVVTQG